MSVLSDILGTGKQTTTTAQTPQTPADVESARRNLLARATAFADQPFAPYRDAAGKAIPRVAGFTTDQERAFTLARDLEQQGTNLSALVPGIVNAATSATRALARTLPNVDLSVYMSPYTESVLDPAIRDIEERAARSRLALGQQAARTGSFGGSRQAISEAELERATQRNIGEESARQRAQAYNQALQQFREDQTRIPSLFASEQSQLGTGLGQTEAAFRSTVNPLLAIGGQRQALGQANLDVLRQQYEEERDFPMRGIEVLRSALGLSPQNLGVGQTTTAQSPGANTLGTVMGGLASLPTIAQGAQTGWNWISSWLS